MFWFVIEFILFSKPANFLLICGAWLQSSCTDSKWLEQKGFTYSGKLWNLKCEFSTSELILSDICNHRPYSLHLIHPSMVHICLSIHLFVHPTTNLSTPMYLSVIHPVWILVSSFTHSFLLVLFPALFFNSFPLFVTVRVFMFCCCRLLSFSFLPI